MILEISKPTKNWHAILCLGWNHATFILHNFSLNAQYKSYLKCASYVNHPVYIYIYMKSGGKRVSKRKRLMDGCWLLSRWNCQIDYYRKSFSQFILLQRIIVCCSARRLHMCVIHCATFIVCDKASRLIRALMNVLLLSFIVRVSSSFNVWTGERIVFAV